MANALHVTPVTAANGTIGLTSVWNRTVGIFRWPHCLPRRLLLLLLHPAPQPWRRPPRPPHNNNRPLPFAAVRRVRRLSGIVPPMPLVSLVAFACTTSPRPTAAITHRHKLVRTWRRNTRPPALPVTRPPVMVVRRTMSKIIMLGQAAKTTWTPPPIQRSIGCHLAWCCQPRETDGQTPVLLVPSFDAGIQSLPSFS
jgi:hypothetical protein